MTEIAALPSSAARVLVVDDEPSITDAVATALRYEGFETMEVGAGRRPSRRSTSSAPT